MIATLTGVVTDKRTNGSIVLEVRGVGYGLLLTVPDFEHIQKGDELKAHIYEHIRENSHDLYGFLQEDTKNLFDQLLDVNGVGPKVALGILGIGTPSTVRQAIAEGDIKRIQAAPGVGKRVAERVVVELKDKVGLAASELADSLLMSEASLQQDEAVQALVTLGFTPLDATRSLQGIDAKLSTEERVKQALKGSAL